MSAREFQPGDVASVQCSDGKWRRATYLPETAITHAEWRFVDGALRRVSESKFRPLVVIDPEQIPHLSDFGDDPADALKRIAEDVHEVGQGDLDATEEIVRWLAELIAPTPPMLPEPTNYLAVVKTRNGKRYWRWSAGTMHTSVPWRRLGAVHADTQGDDGNFRYDELAVVELVSEGVTA